jgi:sulfite exporter TauE/SafE
MVLPTMTRGARRDGLAGAITLGLAWGWLPCGLSYSMLLLAATTASPAGGALVMAAFGVGTLPAMVGATLAFERAARLLARRASLRRVAGGLLLAFGAWTAGSAVYHGLAHAGHAGGAAAHGDHAGHQMMSVPAMCGPMQAAGGAIARDVRSDHPPAKRHPPE